MSASIKIESGIPLPTNRKNSGVSDALRDMKIGQSFFVKGGKIASVGSLARQVGVKVTARTLNGGVRVWRIK